MVQIVLSTTCVIGFILFAIGLQEKFRLIPFCLGIFIFSTSIYLLARLTYDAKQNEIKITVNIDELTEKGGVLYLNREPIFFEQEQIPPILLIRCKSKLVIRRRYNQYYMNINDNL